MIMFTLPAFYSAPPLPRLALRACKQQNKHGTLTGKIFPKPYAASGAYIKRMSNHCRSCPYDPAKATGPTACPFTTLYWDFLDRHRERLGRNPRMALSMRNLGRRDDIAGIRVAARAVGAGLDEGAI